MTSRAILGQLSHKLFLFSQKNPYHSLAASRVRRYSVRNRCFMGMGHGEIRELQGENYQNDEMQVSRSMWSSRVIDPKTRKGRAPVLLIRQLAERLELHRLRCENPRTGSVFANVLGKPLALSITNRLILSLNLCEPCGKRESDHQKADHAYQWDVRIPEWHGWHAAKRGLGSNLYRLGVPDKADSEILRHANVSTTSTYLHQRPRMMMCADAMAKLENHIEASGQAPTGHSMGHPKAHSARWPAPPFNGR